MISALTQKLYYNKFVYCIKFKILENRHISVRDNTYVKQIKELLKNSGISFKTRLDWNIVNKKQLDITFSVYLNDNTVYNNLITDYSNLISWTSKPLNDKHRELLLSKIGVIVREKLLYNRFRYKVYMQVGWKRDKFNEIATWVKTQFEDRPSGVKGDYYMLGTWNVVLYLMNDEDLMMTRMCLSDYIFKIIRIEKLSENSF